MDDHHSKHLSGAIPNAPYVRHPPSPPFIAIPSGRDAVWDQIPDLLPSLENIDPAELSAQQVEIITGNKAQVADAERMEWVYEQRRQAQRILDFLYLGPNNVIRDQAFLKREGITLLLITKEAGMLPARLASANKAVDALGIEAAYIEIESPQSLVKAFAEANHTINRHLLDIYNQQIRQDNTDPSNIRRGKVLISCESGNDRSAAIAAAYIMSTYGNNMATTIRFLSAQRFCCCWDEEVKRKLLSWEDLIKARSQVAASAKIEEARTPDLAPRDHHKRGYEDTMDLDDDLATSETDQDRFLGREAFVPFKDAGF